MFQALAVVCHAQVCSIIPLEPSLYQLHIRLLQHKEWERLDARGASKLFVIGHPLAWNRGFSNPAKMLQFTPVSLNRTSACVSRNFI
jgi:hypothetical protein